ncbi:proteasome subunit beta type-1-like [Drosophila madeirensis]|uniref:Proteasome subunit beta n=1 Tax=Drosophila madeirensis TaxID=30013 RepID=A0AAU9G2L1_DROMD
MTFQAHNIKLPNIYEHASGTVLAIAGKDFVVMGCDTGVCSDCAILSRTQTKLCPMSDQMVVATAGCWSDAVALTNQLKMEQQFYEREHFKSMSIESMAQMLSVVQYQRRHLPYDVCPILGGIDQDGQGAVYFYDCIGSLQREGYRAEGSAGAMLQPVLDSQIGCHETVTKERALSIAKDALTMAARSDQYTGDLVILNIITKDGIELHQMELSQN